MVAPRLRAVWCRQPRTYNTRVLVLGEVFLHPPMPLSRDLEPWCERLPEHTTQLVLHASTGRIFLSQQYLDWYLEAYQTWDGATRLAFMKALPAAERRRLLGALAAYPIIQYVYDQPDFLRPVRPHTPANLGTVEPATMEPEREMAESPEVHDTSHILQESLSPKEKLRSDLRTWMRICLGNGRSITYKNLVETLPIKIKMSVKSLRNQTDNYPGLYMSVKREVQAENK